MRPRKVDDVRNPSAILPPRAKIPSTKPDFLNLQLQSFREPSAMQSKWLFELMCNYCTSISHCFLQCFCNVSCLQKLVPPEACKMHENQWKPMKNNANTWKITEKMIAFASFCGASSKRDHQKLKKTGNVILVNWKKSFRTTVKILPRSFGNRS